MAVMSGGSQTVKNKVPMPCHSALFRLYSYQQHEKMLVAYMFKCVKSTIQVDRPTHCQPMVNKILPLINGLVRQAPREMPLKVQQNI